MNNSEHAALFLEVAKYLEIPDLVTGIAPSKNRDLATRARAAAAELGEKEYEYDFVVTVDDEWVAGGSAQTIEDAEREAQHYQFMYSGDGNCVAVVRRSEVLASFGGREAQQ